MGERAKIILNEYSAKSLLMRDTLDLDKFYTADLKLFVEVARKEISRLQNQLQQKENIIKEVRELVEGRKEHIEELSWVEMKVDDYIEEQDELLEIFDKENK